MEHTLLMLLFSSSIIATLYSFYLNDVILLRFFSAILLAVTAFSLFQPWLFIGFDGTGVETYSGGTAGDPGHGNEEIYLAQGLGFMSTLQLIYTLYLVYKMLIHSKFGKNKEVVERYI